jgi:biopolymer transport protein ExbB
MEIVAESPTMTGYLDQAIGLLDVGGPVVVVLLAMSVFALAILLSKSWQFRSQRVGHTAPARRALLLYRQGRADDAVMEASRSANPAAAMLVLALRGRQRGLPDAAVRETVFNRGSEVLARLRSWFRPLEVIASLAPLLGLFGTVLGMIKAFQQLESAGSQVNPAILSGGIWEALLTTAVGLAVAIPVVALLNWLERRVDRLAIEMESLLNRFYALELDAEAPAPARPAELDREAHHHADAGLRTAAATAGR